MWSQMSQWINYDQLRVSKALGNFHKSDNNNNSTQLNSNFIMKCDKRTQNIESSVRMTVQKNIKKHVNT